MLAVLFLMLPEGDNLSHRLFYELELIELQGMNFSNKHINQMLNKKPSYES